MPHTHTHTHTHTAPTDCVCELSTAYLQLRVVGSADVEVSAGGSSNEIEFDVGSVVAGTEWMNEAAQHGHIVHVNVVLTLKCSNVLEVHVRRTNYVHLQHDVTTRHTDRRHGMCSEVSA